MSNLKKNTIVCKISSIKVEKKKMTSTQQSLDEDSDESVGDFSDDSWETNESSVDSWETNESSVDSWETNKSSVDSWETYNSWKEDSDDSWYEESNDSCEEESNDSCEEESNDSCEEESDDSWEEDFDEPFMPTLKQLCLVKIAIAICNEPEVKTFVQKCERTLFDFSCFGKCAKKNPPPFLQAMNSQRRFKKVMWGLVAKARRNSMYCGSYGVFTSEYARRLVLRRALSGIIVLLRIKWEKIIEMKLSCLRLPKFIQNSLSFVIIGIFWDIYRFTNFDILPTEQQFLNNLCWRTDGEIDFQETAQSLFQYLYIHDTQEIRDTERLISKMKVNSRYFKKMIKNISEF